MFILLINHEVKFESAFEYGVKFEEHKIIVWFRGSIENSLSIPKTNGKVCVCILQWKINQNNNWTSANNINMVH